MEFRNERLLYETQQYPGTLPKSLLPEDRIGPPGRKLGIPVADKERRQGERPVCMLPQIIQFPPYEIQIPFINRLDKKGLRSIMTPDQAPPPIQYEFRPFHSISGSHLSFTVL